MFKIMVIKCIKLYNHLQNQYVYTAILFISVKIYEIIQHITLTQRLPLVKLWKFENLSNVMYKFENTLKIY